MLKENTLTHIWTSLNRELPTWASAGGALREGGGQHNPRRGVVGTKSELIL